MGKDDKDKPQDGKDDGDKNGSKPPPRELACAEDNPFTPRFPPDPEDDDDLLKRLRETDIAGNALHLSLEHFVREDKPARGDDDFPLASLTKITRAEFERIERTKRMSFHTFGCSGDPAVQAPQAAVSDAIIAAQREPDPPVFLFHLGDIVYKEEADEQLESGTDLLSGSKLMQLFYANEFYAAYRGYERPIFAIPGNHDGKYKFKKEDDGTRSNRVKLEESIMWRFLRNFCAAKPTFSDDNPEGLGDPTRPTMTQPYPFFVLKTPVADIIGLYTNVCNAGSLDLKPHTDPDAVQYRWLVEQLKIISNERAANQPSNRALILATHYPPFSGAVDFCARGDVRSEMTPPMRPDDPDSRPVEPLSDALFAAFEETDIWPDLVLSAHAHHYQRLTYLHRKWKPNKKEWKVVRQIPFIIVGCGGHGPVESLWADCAGNGMGEAAPPFDVRPAPGASLPTTEGEHFVRLLAYNDQDFGYLRVTIDLSQSLLFGEYRAAYSPEPNLRPGRVRVDHFSVPLGNPTEESDN